MQRLGEFKIAKRVVEAAADVLGVGVDVFLSSQLAISKLVMQIAPVRRAMATRSVT